MENVLSYRTWGFKGSRCTENDCLLGSWKNESEKVIIWMSNREPVSKVNESRREEKTRESRFVGRSISSLLLALFTQLIEYNGGICWISSLFSRDLVKADRGQVYPPQNDIKTTSVFRCIFFSSQFFFFFQVNREYTLSTYKKKTNEAWMNLWKMVL